MAPEGCSIPLDLKLFCDLDPFPGPGLRAPSFQSAEHRTSSQCPGPSQKPSWPAFTLWPPTRTESAQWISHLIREMLKEEVAAVLEKLPRLYSLRHRVGTESLDLLAMLCCGLGVDGEFKRSWKWTSLPSSG